MRRGTTLLVALLVLFGPAPMSLCAAMAGLPADCAPTPHCAEMGTNPPDAVVTTPSSDCCQMTGAPVPERTTTAPVLLASLHGVLSYETPGLAQQGSDPAPTLAVARSAPLDLQPVLCVFLI